MISNLRAEIVLKFITVRNGLEQVNFAIAAVTAATFIRLVLGVFMMLTVHVLAFFVENIESMFNFNNLDGESWLLSISTSIRTIILFSIKDFG